MAALFVVSVPSTTERDELIKYGEKVLDEVVADGKKMVCPCRRY